MLMNHDQIRKLIEANVIEGASPECINSASLDLRLGRYIMVEMLSDTHAATGMCPVVSLRQRDRLNMYTIDLRKEKHFILRPGQFILAETKEKFNLPLNISAEYKLKSSMARIGLDHLNAGWADAGWTGSVLTLEFRNLTTFHEIELLEGDKIGQMIFFQHEPVELDDSYATRGRYNGLATVSGPIASRGGIGGTGIDVSEQQANITIKD